MLSPCDRQRRRLARRHGLSQSLTLFILAVASVLLSAHNATAVTEEEAEDVQQWRVDNELFDWQQSEPNSSVRVVGAGVKDVDGDLYFAGVKSYETESLDDQNLFVARVNADSSIQWTREFGTDELDGANFITIVNETIPSGVDGEPDTTTEMLYVVGWTWGYLDEGSHALNGFGRFGGRDVVLLKMSLDGEKLWVRQFGTTANDFGYGAVLDGSFQSILLSGTCVTDQIDKVIEVAVEDVLEPRQGFAMYEPQIMDPSTRSSSRQREYEFAISLNFNGDILDYAMDGGVTLTPRRRRISEDGVVAEYAVVLNRQPLEDVIIYADDVRLLDASGDQLQQLRFLSSQNVTFTRRNWNREQVIRVAAVDDMIAEGTHYAVIAHHSESRDPNFDGPDTPFLYGSNVTVQILDNDVAGIRISRRHVFVGEGGGVDTYDIVLRSQPWYPVEIQIVALHTKQTVVSPTSVTFQPHEWNVSQRVTVSAVDDTLSENEYGGVHSGGQIVHFSDSRDTRYHSRRPMCFDISLCDPSDTSVCVLDDPTAAPTTPVRVCDISNECNFAISNGACVSQVNNVDAVDGAIPPRFGNRPLDPSIEMGSENDTEATLTYSELRSILTQQEMDRNLSTTLNVSELYEFVDPPPELKGFVLSFLGLMNMDQVRQLRENPSRTLRAICGGVMRLETMRWGFEEWPKGYTARILDSVFRMFPNLTPRHVWNCGMSAFRPANSIDVTVLDNDPGITLSSQVLNVTEQSRDDEIATDCTSGEVCATYTIVLNAPPSMGGSQPILLDPSICTLENSNLCGWWNDFGLFASTAFDTGDVDDDGKVSIAITGNAQVSISPSVVTFSKLDWYVPQTITVHAIDDAIAEEDAQYTISHRVQSSTVGYSDTTSFWFKGELLSASNYFPAWQTSDVIPYNTAPTVLHSPDHRYITVNVHDDDTAGVNVVVQQPNSTILTKEALDNMDWVGDYVSALGFSDISMASTDSSSDLSAALEGILVFAPNFTTYMKFHVPQLHAGDTKLEFSGAKLQLFQTPYKIFNVSDNSTDSAMADTEDSSFAKVYHTRVTVIEGDWTTDSISDKSIEQPNPVAFLPDASIETFAEMDKSRLIEIDISSLVQKVLPTRLPVLSLQIDVLGGSPNATTLATQLCSSRFERSLKPQLVLAYRFPNLLLGAATSQSSSALGRDSSQSSATSQATDGDRYLGTTAKTEDEMEPWWEASLPKLTRIGTIAVFLPDPETQDGGDSELVYIVMIASSVTFESQPMSLDNAVSYGCPENCPRSQRFAIRRGVLLWDVQAGTKVVRIYREGVGALAIAEVEAYDSFVSVTPTSDGKGIRSRLKSDWTSSRTSDSWRLLQTVRDSEEENLAKRMPTRQSSTFPSHALSYIAVDGEREHLWDPTVLINANVTTNSSTGIADLSDMEPGSTRTDIQTDPWWEVDLGSIVPISSIVVFPFIGEAGHDFCGDEPSAESEAQIGGLFAFTQTDRLLQLKTPFRQELQILVSDASLYGDDAANADVTASSTFAFSCQNHKSSIEWKQVFTKGRFVTVRKRGSGTLMLNEVEVYRWNPATMPQYILLDMFGSGEKAMALTRVELFPPASSASLSQGAPGYALPIAYTIHSKSSQRETSGSGSVSALLTVDSSQCYVSGSASSTHEWIVLALESPTAVGLIDIDADVTRCGSDLEAVGAISIGCYGANVDDVRSEVTASAVTCALDSSGHRLDTHEDCEAFLCSDALCNSQSVAQGTTMSIQLSHFVDTVALGKVELTPTSRLPLSENEHRAIVMRDNPSELWFFDEQPSTFVADRDVQSGLGRLVSTSLLSATTDLAVLNVDDAKEQTFYSNSIVLQPALGAFTLEFWVRLSEWVLSPSSTSSFSIVSLYSGNRVQHTFGSVDVSNGALRFQLKDPSSGDYCSVDTAQLSAESAATHWSHLAASYNPSTASITVSLRQWGGDGSETTVQLASATARCSLAMLAMTQKSLQFGKPSSSSSIAGFEGEIASVAWYPSELTDRVLLDHFHDFFDGVTKKASSSHNAYSLQLAARPPSRVTIDVNAESSCYLFNACNTSVYPSVLEFSPEDWAKPQHIRVLATDDNLFEGFHHTSVLHSASTAETYQLTSHAQTAALRDLGSDNLTTLSVSLDIAVTDFYEGSMLKRVARDSDAFLEQQQLLNEYHESWANQRVIEAVAPSMVYNSSLAIRSVGISIIDLTVPGIEFSTSSLIVSEEGKGNDYQVVLLSEPKQLVAVVLDSETDCYRECFPDAVCPSQSASRLGGDSSICGVGQNGMLCNVSVSPEVLYFSGTNWSIPQTVRVVAIDDMLDEADLHVTTIKASSVSLDPVYHALELPDIAVFVEDNDDTDILYSTKHVRLSESSDTRIGGVNATELDYLGQTTYALSLVTEPWANVTIAMSNEANRSCYRSCGYPFDASRCGLPRQQSVSLVRLGTNSSLEKHEVKLTIPPVTELQRIVTSCDHIDQIFRLQIVGGYSLEIQAVVFTFNSNFKRMYRTSREIVAAVNYGRTFRLGMTGRADASSLLDGFASADAVASALNTYLGAGSYVQVSRDIVFEQSLIQWTVTFTRLLSADRVFPLMTVTASTPFDGTLACTRVQAAVGPTGTYQLRYGQSSDADAVSGAVPLGAAASEVSSFLGSIPGVLEVSVQQEMVTDNYGIGFLISFKRVASYRQLDVNVSGVTPASNAATPATAVVVQTQAAASIGGSFVIEYVSPFTSLKIVNKTNPIPWNASARFVVAEISEMTGLGKVTATTQLLTPEGGRRWDVLFAANNGNIFSLRLRTANLTGSSVRAVVETVRDGESLGGSFIVQMGGVFKRIDPSTKRVFSEEVPVQSTPSLAYNATAAQVQSAILNLGVTGETLVTREDLDCDAFRVCNGYIWTISYTNSPGNLPPINVVGSITGKDASLVSRTVANGTFLGGIFSLTLELLDIDTKVLHVGKTWPLPVSVSAVGMDEALEALPFVRSNREAEFDPETRVWRGIKFDKGVRVYRDGPFLDGGYTWRLEWALQDYIRFEDLRITIDTSRVTQETDLMQVESEFAEDGSPLCKVVPNAHYEVDESDPEGLRGYCVYDIVNTTVQERFLCNFTVTNPWIVYSPHDWCLPKNVELEVVDDWVDEQTMQNGNVTYSNVTHTIFSDDMIYVNFRADPVEVAIANDDVAKVLVSERLLEVSEDGELIANYTLQLNSEPLYTVKVVVLPWLDNNQTLCYRFGLCNLTIPVGEYLFTPRNWNIPQQVVVLATDDDLDEYDVHLTGISHVSYSDDLKYDEIAIPKINVRVRDNDVSALDVLKTQANVTEGGAFDEYSVVLTSEPFAKVTVVIKNVGTKGNYAVPFPTQLTFTWLNWNQVQTVRVYAFDDRTQDPPASSSLMVHSIVSNDLIYAKLRDLTAVTVFITDNDQSGIELSRHTFSVPESNLTTQTYRVRLTSEPWYPVVLIPNANLGCYQRALTLQSICNVTMLTKRVYFGAGNWSNWVDVSFLAVDDWLTETPVHDALITHSTTSNDPLYTVASYSDLGGDIVVSISDNDVSFVNIVLQVPGGNSRSLLNVAEGGFNDSYRVSLASEPYDEVRVTLIPAIETIMNIETNVSTLAPQVGITFRSSSSIGATAGTANSIELVFTCVNWARERVINVMAIDDSIPEVATQYSSVYHSVVSSDVIYNSSSIIGIANVNISITDREAIAPPVPVSATLDGSGSRIDVVFDSNVYHAATMNYSITSGTDTNANRTVSYVIRLKNFPCSLVFDFSASAYSLGTSASCVWIDFKRIRVQLSAGTTINSGDILVLNPCKSFASQYCQAINVLRARYTSRAYSQGSVAVSAPTVKITPNPILMGPDGIGNCGSWSIDASLSTGGGGRPFTTTTWFAVPATLFDLQMVASAASALQTALTTYTRLASMCTKYATDWQTGASSMILVPLADVSAANVPLLSTMAQLRSACYLRSLSQNATTSRSLQLAVDNALIEAGGAYYVGLELVNAFGERSAQMKRVAVDLQAAPQMYVVGDAVMNITRSSELLALQVAATSTCPSVDMSAVMYRWFAISRPSAGVMLRNENLNASNVAKDPRAFRIPRNSLEGNRQYTFCAEVYFAGSSSQPAASASVIVNVGVSIPVVGVSGGSRSIGVKEYLLLSGSAVDPDGSALPFQYAWTCQDITNATGIAPCMDTTTSAQLDLSHAQSLDLSVAPFVLAPYRTLIFSFSATKSGQAASVSTTVWTVAATGPAVAMATSMAKINPSTTLKLAATVSSDYPYSTRWIQDQGDLNMSASVDTNDVFSLPLSNSSNSILKNVLTAGLTYVFRLMATDINGNVGFGSVTVNVNAPPASGTFVVSPRSGYAITDTFSLTCAGWTDDASDFPLKYSFAAVSTAVFVGALAEATDTSSFVSKLLKLATPLVATQSSPTAVARMLPPYQATDSENVTIVAFISDSLGAIAVGYDSIEVILPAQAKSQPMAFVSSMLDPGAMGDADGSQKVKQALSAAMVLKTAFGDQSSCQDSAPASACSSHGICDSTSGKCVCDDGHLGPSCQFELGTVRSVNSAILSTLSSSAQVVDPTSSGLSQQTMVTDTMVKSTPSALSEDDLSDLTGVTGNITGNAFSLSDPQDFFDSGSDTVVSVMSGVLAIGSTAATQTVSAGRRRLSSADTSCGETSPDTTAIKATYRSIIQSLQTISSLASQNLLEGAPASVISSGQVDIYSAVGSKLRPPYTDGLSVNLTGVAIACLPPDLFVNAFAMKTSIHSGCSISDVTPVSRSTVLTVHSQASFDAATAGSNTVELQYLDSSSTCVRRAAVASSSGRRLGTTTDLSTATTKWEPLLVASIPHERTLSQIERRNFSTACRVWNADFNEWSTDICFKDATESTFDTTVCYCNAIGKIELLVTLEESLDFYALSKDLYRDDPISIVPGITIIILIATCAFAERASRHLDAQDAKKVKELAIQKLNRAKWTELETRTQAAHVFEDFDAYCARRKREKDQEQTIEKTGATEATTVASTVVGSGGHIVEASSLAMSQMAAPLTIMSSEDAEIEIPDESRILFSSSSRMGLQYSRATLFFRLCNAILVALGLVLAFVGIDFIFVLGNTTAELLLYVYGKALGIVTAVFGGALVATGSTGLVLARRDGSHRARGAYAFWLSLFLIIQLIFVASASNYLDTLHDLPKGLFSTLKLSWDALSTDVRADIQSMYGCCGFGSVKEEAACPEEALEDYPPRVCFEVLKEKAQELFTVSFFYVEWVFLVEIVSIAVANILVKWRRLRLLQLAGEPASSVSGTRSADRAMLSSQVTTMLMSSLPSIYYVFGCATVMALFYGVDLLLSLNFVSSELVSVLFGLELGALAIVASTIHLIILMKGMHALKVRDARGLMWFLWIYVAFILPCHATTQYFWSLEMNFQVNPAITEAIQAKYLAVSRSRLVALESAMQCCGFTSNSQGTCIVEDNPLPTCQVTTEQTLLRGVSALNRRLEIFVIAEASVFLLSGVLWYRIRRFAVRSSIAPQPTSLELARKFAPVHKDAKMWELAATCCNIALVLLNLAGLVIGLFIVLVGIDALMQLNVLQISYMLRVFDRHVGIYVTAFGGAVEVFSMLGLFSSVFRSRKLLSLYAWVALGLFVASFGGVGVTHRAREVLSSYPEVGHYYVEQLWADSPSEVKQFAQNKFTCCGYDRVTSSNGSVSFTFPAETMSWQQETVITTAYAYSSSALSTLRSIPRSWVSRSLRESTASLVANQICPEGAGDGCSSPVLKYLFATTQYAAIALFVVASVAVVAALCATVVVMHTSLDGRKQLTQSIHWKLKLSRLLLLLVAFGCVFSALVCLLLGLDIASQTAIFSSPLLQLLFSKSVGVALMIFAIVDLTLNFYGARGALSFTVHRIFMNGVGRAMLAIALWIGVGLTGYLSRFSASSGWREQLVSYLDYRWNTLSPTAQLTIGMTYACCGFNDPVLVSGKGIVFDRPPAGYSCSLTNSRGCRGVLVDQLSGSFSWLFQYILGLTLAESVALLLAVIMVRQLMSIKQEEWFRISSRIRYAVGKFRAQARKSHVVVSVYATFDAKLTRTQRVVCVLASLMTTLAIYTGYFATEGCSRTALKTCEQPSAWVVLGMGLLYGGCAGYASQTVCRGMFELVRNRSDDETKEITAARQRKERVLLFRNVFQRRGFVARARSVEKDAVGAIEPEQDGRTIKKPSFRRTGSAAPSSMDTIQATTEERWYNWIARFLFSFFQFAALVQFVVACGVATLMGLVILGYKDTLYNVKIEQGPRELLILAVAMGLTSVVAWVAVDQRGRRYRTSCGAFIAVSVASVVLIATTLVGIYMLYQVLEEVPDASATNTDYGVTTDNWTIRNTGFSVARRLEEAWKADIAFSLRNSAQQQLHCCGFRNANDYAFRPCPSGGTINVDYQAILVNGTVVTKSQVEEQELAGCLPAMLEQFERTFDGITYFAITMCTLEFMMAASAVFLTLDLMASRDAKLKLRVPKHVAGRSGRGVRETFEKVVGLKITAPARGKILSNMLASSLDNVAPRIATELAAMPLTPELEGMTGDERVAQSSDATLAYSSHPKSLLVPTFASKQNGSNFDGGKDIAERVPYPASVVYVVFAIAGVWIVTMGYLIVESSIKLGTTTAWYCLLSWIVGVVFQWAIIEPAIIFGLIVMATLRDWWSTTLAARILHRGRAALRIQPDAATLAARYYASLSLYERIRYNAAVRIQRRLLTLSTRQRFLQQRRELKQQQHRRLTEQRRATLKKTIESFTEEEVTAFSLIFRDTDTAQLGLIPYTVISHSIYQLGVNVPSSVVQQALHEFDPAYADLVDFEHFLYGMHCARRHHQREQADKSAQWSTSVAKEELVSSSLRYGPTADPRAKILVKRQNLLRELKEKRDSLTYKLMGKVGRLPPIRQQRSTKRLPTVPDTPHDHDGLEDVKPVGTFVLMQNRKLSPTKRALEVILKKKHREQTRPTDVSGLDLASIRTEAREIGSGPSSPRQKAKVLMDQWKGRTPGSRARTAKALLQADRETADSMLETAPPLEGTDVSTPSTASLPGVPQALDEESKLEHRVVDSSGEPPVSITSTTDAKPTGAYMLLSKQNATSGKSRVLENLQKKQASGEATQLSESASAKCSAGPISDVAATDVAAEGRNPTNLVDGVPAKFEEDLRTAAAVVPPKTPTTKPMLSAKNNLEKALKKQLGKKFANSAATPPS